VRRLTIIFAVLAGLFVGYVAGCQSRARARLVMPDPEPGQVWIDRSGAHRIVRCVTKEQDKRVVYWHHSVSTYDRRCTIATWRHWVRSKGARTE
jgi:hypothetical protein